MKSSASKNKLVYFLVLAVIGLWGIIIYNIIGYFKSDDDTNLNLNNQTKNHSIPTAYKFSNVDLDTLSFRQLNKSPFEFEKEAVVVPKVIKPFIPPPPVLNYNISGVIINGGKKLVILNDLTNNKTIFLSEGDNYKSISIKSIDVEKVIVIENHVEKTIVLKR